VNVVGYGKGMRWQYCSIQFVATFCDCSVFVFSFAKKPSPFMLSDIDTKNLWELKIDKISDITLPNLMTYNNELI
jgi:hypothetical protein